VEEWVGRGGEVVADSPIEGVERRVEGESRRKPLWGRQFHSAKTPRGGTVAEQGGVWQWSERPRRAPGDALWIQERGFRVRFGQASEAEPTPQSQLAVPREAG